MIPEMLNIIQNALPTAKVESKGKDIIVKSKDRVTTKSELERFLLSKGIPYSSIFKKKNHHL